MLRSLTTVERLPDESAALSYFQSTCPSFCCKRKSYRNLELEKAREKLSNELDILEYVKEARLTHKSIALVLQDDQKVQELKLNLEK